MGSKRGRLVGVALLLLAVIAFLVWLVLFDDPDASPGDDATDQPVPADVTGSSSPADIDPERPGAGSTTEMERTGRGRITGTLRRGDDQSPIAGAAVRLHASGTAVVTTDERGRFTFDKLDRRATYTLEIRVEGTGDLFRTGLVIGRRGSLELGDLFLAPPARIAVHVVDTRGQPISGAKVSGYTVGAGAPHFMDRADPTATVNARTGSDGTATFPGLTSGSWIFVASREGYARTGSAPVEVRPSAETRRFQLTLDAAEPLTGRVVEEDGSAVPRARIVALPRTVMHDAAAAPLALRTYADAMGRYRFDSLPLGDSVLWVARPDEDLMVIAAVRKPGVAAFDLVLPPAARVRGIVKDARTGDPIASATLTATHRTEIGVELTAVGDTDAEGRFDLALPGPGALETLTCRAEGYLPVERTIDIELLGSQTHETALELRRGVPIGGVVNGPAGPVAFADVEIVAQEGGFATWVRTGRDGEFHLDAAPADTPLMLNASSPGLDSGVSSHRFVTARQGARNWYELELRGGVAIVGTVLGGDGDPLPGVDVWLDIDLTGWRARTDDEGRYRIPSVMPGTQVVVQFAHPEHAPAFREVQTEDDEVDAGTLQLRASTRVRGRITSDSGRPLTNAYVQVAGIGGTSLPHPIDLEWLWLSFERLPVAPDGTFDHLLPLVDSHVIVRAVAAEHAPRMSAPLVLGEVAGSTVELTLDAGHEVSGQVLDADGTPVSGAAVSILGRQPGESLDDLAYPGALGPPAAATTDAEGRFTLRHLPAGSYAIRARAPGSRLQAGELIDVPGVAGLVLRLR